MNIELFYAPGSCAFAVLAALEQSSAEYSAIKLDFAAGDQRSREYLNINPLGRVPVLLAEGRIITEAIGTLTYVAARYRDAALLSFDDPLALASEYETLAWFSTSIHLHIAQIFRSERFGDDEDLRLMIKENGLLQFRRELQELEHKCSINRSYTAERFTLVNAFGLVIWRWAQRLECDVSLLPTWSAIIEKDFSRPAVMRAMQREAESERWIKLTAA